MNETLCELLDKGCRELGVELSERQMWQFCRYYELLIERNKVMNLTAITELSDVVTKHFVDSLLVVKAMDDIRKRVLSCIDVGTGAGFPGIPLKIAFPDLKITLLDSLNKRVGFLNDVIGELELSGITAIHGRAEDYGRDAAHREQYDLCVSRAVANLATLSEYCLPFVKIGGTFIPYKSGKIEEELIQGKTAVRKLGGELEQVIVLKLPGPEDVERTFVSVKKTMKTGNVFPRKAGLPSKEPLR